MPYLSFLTEGTAWDHRRVYVLLAARSCGSLFCAQLHADCFQFLTEMESDVSSVVQT